jgi:hypothetical protein
MLQVLQEDGSWKDAFTVDGYKTERSCMNLADKAGRSVRLVDRNGKTLMRVPAPSRAATIGFYQRKGRVQFR